MKIVHLMGALHPSGMERMFVSAAVYFRAKGIEAVIVGQGIDHPFAATLQAAGYRVETIAPIKTPQGLRQWVALLRRESPAVTHIHTEGAFVASALGSRIARPRTRVVRTIHNVFQPTGRALVSRKAQAWIADRAVSEFISVSSDVQENEERFGRRSKLILNWVDDSFHAIRTIRDDGAEPAAVIVGNASPVKNQIVALRAIQKTEHVLYFHGDETYASPEERAILDELATAGRLRYRGTGDPAPSLQKASVFLMPSKHEGMSIALAEAITAGVPALVSDCPGMGWARNVHNVTHISGGQDVWDKALEQMVPAPAGDVAQDLSAARGVRQYAVVYGD